MAKEAVDALFAALVDENARSHLLSSTDLLLDQKRSPFGALHKGLVSAEQDVFLTTRLTFSACLAMLCTTVRTHAFAGLIPCRDRSHLVIRN